MKTEIEAKFLDINIDDIRQKLTNIGAVCTLPMREMRRITIDTEVMKDKNAFLRIRDEGDKVTMTYKQFDEEAIDGAKEIEIEISDLENAEKIIAATGLPIIRRSFQESRRETWQIDGVEVVIDEWPWLKPYIEIEASRIEKVEDVVKRLGLSMQDAAYGDANTAYRAQYPHLSANDTIGDLPEVRFGDQLPKLLRQQGIK